MFIENKTFWFAAKFRGTFLGPKVSYVIILFSREFSSSKIVIAKPHFIVSILAFFRFLPTK